MEPKTFESHIERVDWEPGNNTRYDMLYGEYLDAQGKPMFFVTWLRLGGSGGTTLSWSGGHLHWSYVTEKMQVNSADAAGIMAYLKTQGHEVSIHEDYDDNGVWAPKPTAVEE